MKNRKPREKRASFYDAHFYNILDYFILAVMVAGGLLFFSAALYDKAELYWRKWILNRGI